MNISFSVAMMLEAVNRMPPGIQSAIRDVEKVQAAAQAVARVTNSLKPFQSWSQGLDKTIEKLETLDKKASEISKKGGEIRKNGFENMAEGAAIGLPIFDLVKKAGERQAAQTVLMDSGMNHDEVSKITEQAKKLSSELMFSTNELLAIPLAMNRAGMDAEKIQNSFKQISYVAELEHIRTGRGSYEISKDLSSMAELAQVTNDEEKLKGFMDTVNRIATITTANTGVLAESMKYFAPVAGTYGVKPEDMMMAQGIAARFGIEGSMAGTHLKDFLDRLNPNAATPKQLGAMYQMGFLQDAQVMQTKSGKLKVSGGESVFFQDGKAKNMLDIFGIFADKYKQMTAADPENGSLKFAGYMKQMLGEQGKDIGMIVAQNADKIQKMREDYQKVLTVEEGVKNFQQTFKQTFGAFMSNLENIGVDAVTQLMHDITDGLKTIGPYVEATSKWVNEHKELVTWLLKTALAISAVLLVLGVLGVVGGTAIKLLGGGFRLGISPILGMLKAVRALSRGLGDLKAGYDLYRMAGSGVGGSLLKGARLALPKLDKWVISPAIKLAEFLAGCSKMVVVWTATRLKMLVGWIAAQAKMVGTWLASAARIAAGWLIAMGPVGWIILGVTAIIAAAVWAWNNNFMGFRDKCLSVWSAIRDWGSRAWNSISDSVRSAIDLVCSWIDKAKEALGVASKVPANLGHSEVMVNRWLQHDGAGGDDSGSLFKPNAPFIGGGSGGDTISSVTTHNVSINVASTREAADMVIKLPQKYTANNADFNLAT